MQERSHYDTRQKLFSWSVGSDDIDQILADLIEGNYLNEERFAKAFASGRFRIKKWGWVKIEHALKQKRVSSYSIALAKSEIEPEDLEETLSILLKRKALYIKGNSEWERKQKLTRFAVGRGYSFEEINRILATDFFKK